MTGSAEESSNCWDEDLEMGYLFKTDGCFLFFPPLISDDVKCCVATEMQRRNLGESNISKTYVLLMQKLLSICIPSWLAWELSF